MTTDLVYYLVSCGIGALSIYLTAYLRFKGKNKALHEDNRKLEEEKQKIIAKFRAETEKIKKQHSLDIEKRKYQYEGKRSEFAKYFALLDEFHGKSNSLFVDKFQPIIDDLLLNFLSDDVEIKNSAIARYNRNVQSLMMELNEEYLKIKSEQRSIRLVSSPKLDELLDKLEVIVGKATEASTEMLKVMSSQEFWIDQSIIAPYKEKAESYGQIVQNCHEELKIQMKIELNEI